jgi:hypothetical protein
VVIRDVLQRGGDGVDEVGVADGGGHGVQCFSGDLTYATFIN